MESVGIHNMKRERVLVIEDESDILELLRFNLKKEGYDVDTATDGERGVDHARSKAYDVVLLDLMLPGIDGLEVCRRAGVHALGVGTFTKAGNLFLTNLQVIDVKTGETTPDRLFTLETVACLGTCFLSPVMTVDDRFYGNLTPDKAATILEACE